MTYNIEERHYSAWETRHFFIALSCLKWYYITIIWYKGDDNTKTLLELLSIFSLVIFGVQGLSMLFTDVIKGVIILAISFILSYTFKKLSKHESYKKKMYDLMRESVELQKKNMNEGEDD